MNIKEYRILNSDLEASGTEWKSLKRHGITSERTLQGPFGRLKVLLKLNQRTCESPTGPHRVRYTNTSAKVKLTTCSLNTPPASPHSPPRGNRDRQGENYYLPLKGRVAVQKGCRLSKKSQLCHTGPRSGISKLNECMLILNPPKESLGKVQNDILFGQFRRNVPVFVTLVFLLVFLLGNIAKAQSIEDYQQIAAENNPEVQSAFHQYLASLEEPAQVGTLPDPEVAFAYFISPIKTRLGPQQARISLTQMFPWFGTLGNREEIASIKSKTQFETFRETRNRIFYQTEIAFLELYEIDKTIAITEENLEILNSLVEISLRRYETNQATQVDVLRAQIEQEDLKTQLALLRDNRSVLMQRIKELLNDPQQIQIQIPDTLNSELIPGDYQMLRNQLVQQNPTLSRLRYLEESSREMRDLAEKDGKPSFGIGMDYIFTGERTDMTGLTGNGQDALIARASFRIPLFRNKYNAKVQQAQQNIQSAQMQISSKANSLQTDLDASLRDYYDAERRFELYDQIQIQRVNQALTIMMQAYSTDSSNFEEILRMQRKLLEYQLNQIQAFTNMHKAIAYIEYLTGRNNINLNEIENL